MNVGIYVGGVDISVNCYFNVNW